MYQGSTQVRLIAQGASVEEFERWEPHFYEAMRTAIFGDWWSEMLGAPWLPQVFPHEEPGDGGDSETRPT